MPKSNDLAGILVAKARRNETIVVAGAEPVCPPSVPRQVGRTPS